MVPLVTASLCSVQHFRAGMTREEGMNGFFPLSHSSDIWEFSRTRITVIGHGYTLVVPAFKHYKNSMGKGYQKAAYMLFQKCLDVKTSLIQGIALLYSPPLVCLCLSLSLAAAYYEKRTGWEQCGRILFNMHLRDSLIQLPPCVSKALKGNDALQQREITQVVLGFLL